MVASAGALLPLTVIRWAVFDVIHPEPPFHRRPFAMFQRFVVVPSVLEVVVLSRKNGVDESVVSATTKYGVLAARSAPLGAVKVFDPALIVAGLVRLNTLVAGSPELAV